MSRHSTLLVVNFVMDPENPLLSHQLEAVQSLADRFFKVIVITGKSGNFVIPRNVVVYDSNWIPGKPISNLIRLIRISFPLILKGNFDSAFFHMTDLQCAILAPIIRIRGKKQALWYAHTKKSLYLRWAFRWVDSVVTSTKGSCPLTGGKIICIGQAIDSEKFKEIPVSKLDFNRLIHIGRFDRSKNIEMLIEQAQHLRRDFPDLTLSIVGTPANNESRVWAENLVKSSESEISKCWLAFSKSIPRAMIPSTIENSGCFFHAYMGSLDKTLVEATMLGVPVVSINPEYMSIFGKWSSTNQPDLSGEYAAFRDLTLEEIAVELRRRRTIATDNHSLKNWTAQLVALLE